MKTCIIQNSSNVRRIAHYFDTKQGEEQEGVLLACMKGGEYAYLGVPSSVFDSMCAAESAGKFLNAEIKDKYVFRHMTDDERRMMDEAEPMASNRINAYTSPHSNLIGETTLVPPFNNWGQTIDLKFLDPEVRVGYAKAGDAAFDLMASSVTDPVTNEPKEFPTLVLPGQHVLIGTGIAMKLAPGLAGLVVPRSGLAKKHRVSVVNTPGLIDSGYTGEIGVLFENRGDVPIMVNQYDRIAQFLIVPAITPTFRVVTDLEQTERGSSGFGSSGVAKSQEVVV